MSKIAACFLINIKETNSVAGYSIKSPTKKIQSKYLKLGVYLCFIDEILIAREVDEQFCEILYEGELIIIRYKDIAEFII